MALRALICPQCGAHLNMDDSRDFGFCEFCGAKVVIREVIEVKHSGKVAVDGVATIDTMLEQAFIKIEDKEFYAAWALLDRVLEASPKNWKAYLGKLLCKLEITSTGQLINNGAPLTQFDEFKRAVQFAPDDKKNELNQINQDIINRTSNNSKKTIVITFCIIGFFVLAAVLVILLTK